MKILFIDEGKPFVDIYRDVFQKNGYEFITTFDIQKVLDLTELERPDVVLLDIVIPKPDNVIAEQGYSYLEKVKSNPKTKNIPVIVFSNLDSPEDRKKYKEFGAAAFMFKRDCTSKEVLEVVDQIIKKSKK